ncbi:10807_t:CDS:2, partial [Funneliformis caledonium]
MLYAIFTNNKLIVIETYELSEAKSAMLFNEQDLNDRMEEMSSLERSLEAQESELDKIRESLREKVDSIKQDLKQAEEYAVTLRESYWKK